MKTINETFTDAEFKKLLKRKGKLNWHDYMIFLSQFAYFYSNDYEVNNKAK